MKTNYLQPLLHHSVHAFVAKCDGPQSKKFFVSQRKLHHRIHFHMDETGCIQQWIREHC